MEPEDYVRELSSAKAQSVLEQYADKEDSVIVIGADTIVYHKGEILTKPKNEEDAFRILKSLEGQIHQVYTGVTILQRMVLLWNTRVKLLERLRWIGSLR